MNQIIIVIIVLVATYFIFKLLYKDDTKNVDNIQKTKIPNIKHRLPLCNIKTQPLKHIPARKVQPLRVDMPKFYTNRIPPVMVASPSIY